jgi:hypothetical protein
VKKILAVLLTLISVLAMTVPVAAAEVGTGVTVSTGSGAIPIVKCKWEQEPFTEGGEIESGDPSHSVPGFQILPPLVHDAYKPIEYYAVVTDEEEMGNIYEVFAYVFHPVGSPAPYNATVNPGGEYFKYKVVFTNLGFGADAKQKVLDACDAGLIKFNDGFDIDEITNAAGTGELDKGTACVWMGTEVIHYEQPAGDYRVEVYAVDHTNNVSSPLINFFNYVPTCGVEVDFTGVTYGPVNLNIPKTVAGDLTWDTPFDLAPVPNRATVRNIGNTWAHVTVAQDDMAFGKAGSAVGTAYQGSVPPTSLQSNWNVFFGARMGNDVANQLWYDPTASGQPMTNRVTLPNYLGLSTMDELDFSICVKNGFGTHAGLMSIGCEIEAFSTPGNPSGVPSH